MINKNLHGKRLTLLFDYLWDMLLPEAPSNMEASTPSNPDPVMTVNIVPMKLFCWWKPPMNNSISLRHSYSCFNFAALMNRGRSKVSFGIWFFLCASDCMNFIVVYTQDRSLGCISSKGKYDILDLGRNGYWNKIINSWNASLMQFEYISSIFTKLKSK